MSEKAPPDIDFVRQMGIGHAEFFRILPPVVERVPHRISDLAVHIEDGARSAAITLGPQVERRLGGVLRLPGFELRFAFRGYTREEVDAFMARFDRVFHRGGG